MKILQKRDLVLNCLYSNVDQLVNKMDDLHMQIASEKPDIILFAEVIPKAQKHPILETQTIIAGYDMYNILTLWTQTLGHPVYEVSPSM